MLKGTSLTSLNILTIKVFKTLLKNSKYLNKLQFMLPLSHIQELLSLHMEGYLPKLFVFLNTIAGYFEDWNSIDKTHTQNFLLNLWMSKFLKRMSVIKPTNFIRTK